MVQTWRAENDILKKILTKTMYKEIPMCRPRTRWKDIEEKDIWMVNRNVSIDLSFDRER